MLENYGGQNNNDFGSTSSSNFGTYDSNERRENEKFSNGNNFGRDRSFRC